MGSSEDREINACTAVQRQPGSALFFCSLVPWSSSTETGYGRIPRHYAFGPRAGDGYRKAKNPASENTSEVVNPAVVKPAVVNPEVIHQFATPLGRQTIGLIDRTARPGTPIRASKFNALSTKREKENHHA